MIWVTVDIFSFHAQPVFHRTTAGGEMTHISFFGLPDRKRCCSGTAATGNRKGGFLSVPTSFSVVSKSVCSLHLNYTLSARLTRPTIQIQCWAHPDLSTDTSALQDDPMPKVALLFHTSQRDQRQGFLERKKKTLISQLWMLQGGFFLNLSSAASLFYSKTVTNEFNHFCVI